MCCMFFFFFHRVGHRDPVIRIENATIQAIRVLFLGKSILFSPLKKLSPVLACVWAHELWLHHALSKASQTLKPQ